MAVDAGTHQTDPDKLTEMVEALVVTRGGKGSFIYVKGKCHVIPAAKPKVINDPTGCGDAYRAGLLYGLMHDMDWDTSGRIASVMGTIKIECYGTQNHTFELQEFKDRFKENFGYTF
jgi:Sugar kinases, ribokinase family